MYKIYIDKNETFEASFQIEGIDSNIKPKCRLVLESSKFNILFEGTIQNNKCIIPIKKLKSILEAGDTGRLKLEVIADDVFFTPWEQDFTATVSKKLTVEVKSNSTTTIKPTMTAVVNNTKEPLKVVNENTLIKELNKYFKRYNISLLNVADKRKQIKTITESVSKSKSFVSLNLSTNKLIDIVIKSLPNK